MLSHILNLLKKINFRNKNIPEFNTYFPDKSMMNSEQLYFYNYWKSNILSGTYIELNGNLSYAFVFLNEILKEDDPVKKLKRFKYFLEIYNIDDKVSWYCNYWIIDNYIEISDLESAMLLADIKFGDNFINDNILSIKAKLGVDLSAENMLMICKKHFTNLLKKEYYDVIEYLNEYIENIHRNESKNILDKWIQEHSPNLYTLYLYSGSRYSTESKNQNLSKIYLILSNKDIINQIKKIAREAENNFRVNRKIPKVGEGWVSETNLYYQISSHYKDINVIHHAKPKWLKRQHLDIYIEDFLVAIEYQGMQHYKPIDFFGGEKAFIENQKRDKKKKGLCTRNGISLIYVNDKYTLEDVISEIESKKIIKSFSSER